LKNNYSKAIFGITAVTLLIIAEVILLSIERKISIPIVGGKIDTTYSVQFLAFGDVNLGRTVGQKILKISPQYPFERYSISQDSADIVFANLESQISDQKGETGHPKFNLIFTAPPEAIATLQQSGIDIVSTANNHALDYGIAALEETIDRLQHSNIPFVGTSKRKENLFRPLIFEKNKIKFAIFAVSAFVNMTFKDWRNYLATPDTVRLLKEITSVKDSVDVVIMSYHGGVEYIDRPVQKVKDFANWSADHGVDIFLGHHPHVTHGIAKRGKSFIVHSLGNFVFFQPQHYWTQRSYGVKFLIEKKDSVTNIQITKLLPVNVSMRTERLKDSTERSKLIQRTQKLSNIDLSSYWN